MPRHPTKPTCREGARQAREGGREGGGRERERTRGDREGGGVRERTGRGDERNRMCIRE